MIKHLDLGENEDKRRRNLASLIHKRQISLAGYRKGKIYGLLNCSSGKRMKVENRVFFQNQSEALANGYRPCGTCLPQAYSVWKEVRKITRNSEA